MRLLRISVLIALITALVGGATACSSSDSADGSTHVVKTDQGDVEVPDNPKRVVLLNYALAGYLYDLDVPVVAMTPEHTEAKGEFAPAWKEKAEKQGTQWLPWDADGFDTEAIMSFEPDLIIGGGIGFPLKHATEAYKDLSDIAPTVVVSGDLTQWQDQFQFLADKVFDKPEVYQDALNKYDARINQVRENITVPPGESAFLSVNPGDQIFVIREDRGLPVEFAKLGFRPAKLFATGKYQPYVAGGDSFPLSTEQVGQVLTMDTLFFIGFHTDTDYAEVFRTKPVTGQLPAFKKNQAYDLPYWAHRGDYHEAMALLDIVEQKFKKA